MMVCWSEQEKRLVAVVRGFAGAVGVESGAVVVGGDLGKKRQLDRRPP